MTTEPKITIVIINWNGLKDTLECIESLMNVKYSNYEILLIDNGSSSDEVRKIKDRFGNINIVELKQNLGFAIANNVGIRISLQKGSDYVLLLNNDTVVDPSFLKEMVEVAQSDPNIGILGPKIYFYDNKDKFWYAGGKLNMYFNHTTEGQHQIDVGQYENIKQTDWISGACMLIRKSVFDKAGLLPREYFLGWEDIDFCVEAKRKGFLCIFVPRSRIWHKASASYKRHNLSYKQIFFGFRNRIIMRYKFLSKPKFTLFITIQFFIVFPTQMLYYIVVYKDHKRVISMFKGMIAGIKNMHNRKIMYKLGEKL
jgi:GT2 family glycosyltransferase